MDDLYGDAADPLTVEVAGVKLDKNVVDMMQAQREKTLAKRQARTAPRPEE